MRVQRRSVGVNIVWGCQGRLAGARERSFALVVPPGVCGRPRGVLRARRAVFHPPRLAGGPARICRRTGPRTAGQGRPGAGGICVESGLQRNSRHDIRVDISIPVCYNLSARRVHGRHRLFPAPIAGARPPPEEVRMRRFGTRAHFFRRSETVRHPAGFPDRAPCSSKERASRFHKEVAYGVHRDRVTLCNPQCRR